MNKLKKLLSIIFEEFPELKKFEPFLSSYLSIDEKKIDRIIEKIKKL
jgi:hypothetical protein